MIFVFLLVKIIIISFVLETINKFYNILIWIILLIWPWDVFFLINHTYE